LEHISTHKPILDAQKLKAIRKGRQIVGKDQFPVWRN